MSMLRQLKKNRKRKIGVRNYVPWTEPMDLAINLLLSNHRGLKEVIIFNRYKDITPGEKLVDWPSDFVAPTDDAFIWNSTVNDDQCVVLFYNVKYTNEEIDFNFKLIVGKSYWNYRYCGEGHIHATPNITLKTWMVEEIFMDGSYKEFTEEECKAFYNTYLGVILWAIDDIDTALGQDFDVAESPYKNKYCGSNKRGQAKGITLIHISNKTKRYGTSGGATSKKGPSNVIRHKRYLRDERYSEKGTLPLQYDKNGKAYYKMIIIEPYPRGGGVNKQIKVYK